MRRPLLGLSASLALLLAACGGAPSTPNPVQTLYQGDWSWSVVQTDDVTTTASGVASFSFEQANTSGLQKGKLRAGGLFDASGVSTKPYGLAAMGALDTTARNSLDVAFSYADGETPVLLAVDSDGVMGRTSDGKKMFKGSGQFYPKDAQGNDLAPINVSVVLIQKSTTPTYKPSGVAAAALPAGQLAAIRTATTTSAQSEASDAAQQLALSGARATGQGKIVALFKNALSAR